LKHLLYKIFRQYVRIGLFFTLKKITVFGKEDIPEKGASLFIANHQNGLIDAILIPITNNRNIHFLTRASAFTNKSITKFLNSLNMIPIYRNRDGVNTIEKNSETFEQCTEILKNGEAIEIFAEGEHHLDRRIIPLKKGFARIILATLQKYPDLEIQIIPIGINYNSHLDFPASVSIYYGKSIKANPFFNLENPEDNFSEIVAKVFTSLKNLTLHIENRINYDQIVQNLENNNIDYLNPFEANEMLKNIEGKLIKSTIKKSNINWFSPFILLAKLNSIFPLLIWRYIKSNIKEIIFTNTYRFAVIMTIFPLFYLIQTGIIFYLFNFDYAIIYLITCIFLGVITTKKMELPQNRNGRSAQLHQY